MRRISCSPARCPAQVLFLKGSEGWQKFPASKGQFRVRLAYTSACLLSDSKVVRDTRTAGDISVAAFITQDSTSHGGLELGNVSHRHSGAGTAMRRPRNAAPASAAREMALTGPGIPVTRQVHRLH